MKRAQQKLSVSVTTKEKGVTFDGPNYKELNSLLLWHWPVGTREGGMAPRQALATAHSGSDAAAEPVAVQPSGGSVRLG